MHRFVRRLIGLAAAVSLLAGMLTAATGSPAAAANRHSYTVTATAHRSSTARATVNATASASVTAKVSVPGHSAVSASATATGRATSVGTARSSATGRGAAVATVRSTAAARARTRAAAQAVKRAHTAAAALAKQRATTAARALARSRAAALAKKQALALAANRAKTLTGQSTTALASPPTTGPAAPPAASKPASSATPASCGGESPAKATGGAWTCTFDEEFNGTSLDPTKWTAQRTADSAFTAGGVCYLDSPNNVSVSGGNLALTVRREAAPFSCSGLFNTSYTGGSVTTYDNFSQAYGRFEVRAKLPATTVAGLQETLWLWPDDALKYGPRPTAGEIDFAEFYSQYPGWTIPYIHYVYNPATVNWGTNTNVYTAWPAPYNQPGMNCQIDQSAFNTYAVTWVPGQITIAVNGHNCIIDNYQGSTVPSPAPFNQPFLIALTQALGTGTDAPTAATPLPATTLVDYVRVWK